MRLDRKFLSGGIGLVVVAGAIVVIVLLQPQPENTVTPDVVVQENNTSSVVVSDVVLTAEIVETVKELPELPQLAFVTGSVEEACGLNEYVPYHYDHTDNPALYPKSPYGAEGNLSALDVSECDTALETHIGSINPYLWGESIDSMSNDLLAFAFVKLENPLTFGRIFADPIGDLERVKEALSRPECLLQTGESNRELRESCHADALMNYALLNRFCYDGGSYTSNGVFNREMTIYWEEDNPTPEQDRAMWKQALEGQWVRRKCEALDPVLELTKQQPELFEQIKSFGDPEEDREWRLFELSQRHLIELAARLGDDAAGLTIGGYNHGEEGYKYGRFADLLDPSSWEYITLKHQLDASRFEHALNLLTYFGARRPDPRDEIEFDWEAIVQHICTRVYVVPPEFRERVRKEEGVRAAEAKTTSCQEFIHTLRQQEIKFAPLVSTLDKFEQIALKLNVYD